MVHGSIPPPPTTCQDLSQLRACCRRLQAELTASRWSNEPGHLQMSIPLGRYREITKLPFEPSNFWTEL